MENVTSKCLKRKLKIFVTIYVIFIALMHFIGAILALSDLLFALLIALGGIAAGSVGLLPLIIYYAIVNKRFKKVLQTAEIKRGILLGFGRPFTFRSDYGYMEIDGKTYRPHSIYSLALDRNVAYTLVNKEVNYVFDGERIYLIGE